MRKTDDSAQGRVLLLEAFKEFGKIEDAAIAPCNSGFDTVRFVEQKSVEKALGKKKSLLTM